MNPKHERNPIRNTEDLTLVSFSLFSLRFRFPCLPPGFSLQLMRPTITVSNVSFDEQTTITRTNKISHPCLNKCGRFFLFLFHVYFVSSLFGSTISRIFHLSFSLFLTLSSVCFHLIRTQNTRHFRSIYVPGSSITSVHLSLCILH